MEFEKMTVEELEARKAQIATEIEAEDADLDALEAEVRGIKEELERRKADAAQREELRKMAAEQAEVVEAAPVEERKEEKMSNIEIRKSPEYLDAWVENLKGRATEEQRALLTQNVEDGTIAVPVYVQDKIETSWESNELMRLVRRTYFPGNLRVGYEASSDGAKIHEEGGDPITEENLEILYFDLIPAMVKKMVRVSDEVIGTRGQEFIDYIFDEVEYQIIKLLANSFIAMAATEPLSTGLVKEYEAAGASLTAADIVNAEGLLGAEATNPVLFITRTDAAALKAAALSAGYGYDPFDGMQVIYVPATALSGKMAVIADPSAFQVNLPEGDTVKFKFDDLTEAAADMVRIIGRLYVASGIVAPGRVVRIATA